MTDLFKTLQSSAAPDKGSDKRLKQPSCFCVLHMIRASFMINQFFLSTRFFKLIDSAKSDGVDLGSMPKSWQVQVAYYQGRYHMYNNDFEKARAELRRAFQLCYKDNFHNKQRILRYLVPVEMLIGRFPSQKLLKQYELAEYNDMVEACLNGDMPAFEAAMEKNMDALIYSGVFTTVEQIRLLTLCNFVRRVALAVQSAPECQKQNKPNIISLQYLFHPLRNWDNELDLDEVECLLANLIGNGMIKGYISHEQRVLVLSKNMKDAFPTLE